MVLLLCISFAFFFSAMQLMWLHRLVCRKPCPLQRELLLQKAASAHRRSNKMFKWLVRISNRKNIYTQFLFSPIQLLLPEGWKQTLPKEQHLWVSKALFIRDKSGRLALTKNLRLWWFPPGPRPLYVQPPPSPDGFFSCQTVLVGPLPHVGIQVAVHTAHLSSPWHPTNSLWDVQDCKAGLGCQRLVFHGYGVPWMPVLQKEAGSLVTWYSQPARSCPPREGFDLQVGRLFIKVWTWENGFTDIQI